MVLWYIVGFIYLQNLLAFKKGRRVPTLNKQAYIPSINESAFM